VRQYFNHSKFQRETRGLHAAHVANLATSFKFKIAFKLVFVYLFSVILGYIFVNVKFFYLFFFYLI
jgi:hypothetical protein